MNSAYEPVIGLEVHVQLATRTKLFCGDRTEFGEPPNTLVCPVCLGLPGALPVLNEAAVRLAIRAAAGFECMIHDVSVFARKNYFYPDLPKGYQITQFERPIATGGRVLSGDGDGSEREVRLRRIHIEEDAGKLIHDRVPGATAVDLNRAGTPLIEIVTEPDIVSPAHARAFLTRLKQTLAYLEISDCDMEKGSLRVDANVSIRRRGVERLGTKTEVKNMNSFSSVERALTVEIERQTGLLDAGAGITHQTLLWDAGRNEVRPMRSKEESHDYRYFPEPDLPPLVLDAAVVAEIVGSLPELPVVRERRFVEQYGLPDYDAGVLTALREVADYYEDVVAGGLDAKAASNWVMTDVLGWLNERHLPIDAFPVPARQLAELITLTINGTLSSSLARRVFGLMIETGDGPAVIVEREGLTQIRDTDQLRAWIESVVAEHPAEVERYRAGDPKLLAFFMGRIMKRSAGKADPRQATQLLRERLSSG
jgi:aspartyl-tRNA(Asn)/glutamyl-tRNA(Gln) amidotransferase subunit B